MKLISPGQFVQIFKALRDVRDTFDTQPITYYLKTGSSINRWQEDRPDLKFTAYPLLAFTEYSTENADEINETQDGAFSQDSITVTMGREYLAEQGLVDPITLLAIFKDDTDYFKIGNVNYKVVRVIHDGLLDGKNVNVVITGLINNNFSINV